MRDVFGNGPHSDLQAPLSQGPILSGTAEDAARELPNLPLEDALQLVDLYAERGSPKYGRAAMRWLERYLAGLRVT